jgi:hypothetical protein
MDKANFELQDRFAKEIKHRKFIPFLTLHEFEAWLFCSPDTVARHFGCIKIANDIRNAVKQAGEPELINHGEKTIRY